MNISASVAVPTQRRPGDLISALHSLIAQDTASSYEILVLDNACDPHLEAEVTRVGKHARPSVRYLPVPQPGLHNGRHTGAKHAQSDLLIFVDDDIIASSSWIEAIVEAFQDPTVHLVGGRSLPLYEAEPPHWIEAFWSHAPAGWHRCGYLSLADLGDDTTDIDPIHIWGLNFSIRRQTLELLGGFNPDGMPWELRHLRGDGESAVTRKAQALGLRAVYRPDALVYHRVPRSRLTLDYFERRAYLQGISDSFAHIRRAGRVEPLPWEQAKSEASTGEVMQLARTFRHLIRHPWKCTRSVVHRCVGRFQAAKAQTLDTSTEISIRVEKMHRAGYQFHHEEVARNPALLEWVLREGYWDANPPQSSLVTIPVSFDRSEKL